jgi:shikimate dehydrogenase
MGPRSPKRSFVRTKLRFGLLNKSLKANIYHLPSTIHNMFRYAVFGNPIAHSKSPLIHTAFAQQTHQSIQYEAILVDIQPGEFAKAVQTFQDQGGNGFNITVPFKQAAFDLADQRTPRAQLAGAVNTMWFDDHGRRMGDNTDGIGILRDLRDNHGLSIHERRLLILGAGGAVRGVLEPLLKESPALCVIANRTLAKAQELVELFAPLGKNVTACSYDALTGQSFDLIINGTSTSLHGELPPLSDGILVKQGWAYDMMYANEPTVFMQWALAQGAERALDGLGMLVEQAAEAFYIWRGIRPDTAPVIAQLRPQKLRFSQKLSFSAERPVEIGGPAGLEPTRYGDWERKGRCIDF